MNTQLTILDELRGGDGRSIGRTSQVVAIIRRQPELRRHLAQVLPRLELSRRDHVIVVAVFRRYLQDQSRIVMTFAMQGLTDLAMQEPRLRTPIRRRILSLMRTGSPSMKSRGRKLLLQLHASTVPCHAPVAR